MIGHHRTKRIGSIHRERSLVASVTKVKKIWIQGGNWWNPARDICPVETRRKEREEERARKVHVCVCVCVRIGRNRAAAKNLCFSSDRSLEAGREAVWRALVSQPTVSPFPTTDVVIAHETRLFPFLLSSFLRATACRAAYIPYIRRLLMGLHSTVNLRLAQVTGCLRASGADVIAGA